MELSAATQGMLPAPRASVRACVGMPARLRASASRCTSSLDAGRGSNGPTHVGPGPSMLITPGAVRWPAGRHTPRITRDTCPAMISSLPIPFCTEQTAASASDGAVAAIAAPVNIDLVATIPSSQRGISRASVRACTRAVSSTWPVSRNPSRLIASTCSAETS